MLRICSLFVLIMVAALSARAEVLAGTPRVIDGDTLAFGPRHVRLMGIDAPELAQRCGSGAGWACGQWARGQMLRLTGRRQVTCDGQQQDQYHRLIARCRVGRTDLGAAMVTAGAALDYRRYSRVYVAQERMARAARRGIWSGPMLSPAAFRAAERRGKAQGGRTGRGRLHRIAAHPAGCAIKGNISAGGRIYHLPGQPSYAATRISPARGERWFCSVAAARAAGWRPARR